MQRMADLLIWGDSLRVPEMRHEVPYDAPDPFLYAERDGDRHVYIGALELPNVRELTGLHAHAFEEIGVDDLHAQGLPRHDVYLHLVENACRALGITEATVPRGFPVAFADHLRAAGVRLVPSLEPFGTRRRVKAPYEIEGIRRAQAAAEAGMDAVRDLLRRADVDGAGGLVLGGAPLTSERCKAALHAVYLDRGMIVEDSIVSHGPQSAIGHHMGAGQIRAGEPIVVDTWPKDRESSCFADMTRTFCVGDPPEELVAFHRHTLDALGRTLAATRAGAPERSLYDLACDVFESAGYPTQRTKRPGEVLEDGFFHGLGHGVGLEVHEAPNLGVSGKGELVAGDVVTLEPGLYRPGFGGCRLEDLALVTADGCENLTSYPYDLAP